MMHILHCCNVPHTFKKHVASLIELRGFRFQTYETDCNLESLNKAPLITFIIPAYNAIQSVANALESLINQTSCNWEAVVVNDGSTDGTDVLIETISSRSQNIRVLHQTNAGVAAARNAAIKVAQGEYLSFLDADDMIVPDYVEKLEGILCQKHPDVLALAYRSFPSGKTFGYGSFEGDSLEFLKVSLLNKYATFPCWLFLVSKQLVIDMNIDFSVGRRTGEDQEFILKSLCRSSTCLSVDNDDIYYLYRTASNTSAMASNLEGQFDYPRAMLSVLELTTACVHLCDKPEMREIRRLLFERYIGACLYATETALINGATFFEVRRWSATAFDKIYSIADDFGLQPSFKIRCLLSLWNNWQSSLLVLLKVKPHLHKVFRVIKSMLTYVNH